MGNLCGKPQKQAATYDAATRLFPIVVPSLFDDSVSGVCSAGAGRVLSGGQEKTLRLWDWTTGLPLEAWSGHEKAINNVAYAPRADLAFTGSRDQTAACWAKGKPDPVQRFTGHTLTVSGLSVSEQHGQLATGSRDYSVRLWDLNTAQLVRFSKVSRNVVTALQWIPLEPSIVQTSEDLMVRVWDARTMTTPSAQTFRGHVNIPLSCDVSPCGNYILTCSHGFDSHGCEGRLWDRRKEGECVYVLEGHSESANACCFLKGRPMNGAEGTEGLISSGGTGLVGVTVSSDQSVRVWDTRQQHSQLICAENFQPQLTPGPLTCVAALPPDAAPPLTGADPLCDLFCVGNFSGAMQIWGLAANKEGDYYCELLAHTAPS